MGATAAATVTPMPPRRDIARVYERLVSFNVRHDFYAHADGYCTDLVLAPTPQTVRRLARFGFIVQTRDDGLDLVWKSDLADKATAFLGTDGAVGNLSAHVLSDIVRPPLLFTVSAVNRQLANFTDMPSDFAIGHPPMLLSNNAADITGDRAASFRIDWNRKVDRPADRGPVAAYAIDPKMRASLGGDSVKAMVSVTAATAERDFYLAHSTHFALIDLYWIAPLSPESNDWSGYPIDLDRGAAGKAAGIPTRYFQPCHYDIRLGARRTMWRYLIAARHGELDTDSLQIVAADDGSDAGFIRQDTMAHMPDGRPAVCFVSPAPLPMLARQDRKLSLVGLPIAGKQRRRTLVHSLPLVGTHRIAPETRSTSPPVAQSMPPGTAWADLYVFI